MNILVPCKTTKYSINNVGFNEDFEYYGVNWIFDKVIEKTVSELQYSGQTLVTRFGGFIGISKNLLWFIILIISSMTFLWKKICNNYDPSSSLDPMENMSNLESQKSSQLTVWIPKLHTISSFMMKLQTVEESSHDYHYHWYHPWDSCQQFSSIK